MADYIVNTDEKRRQMLDAVGIRDIDELLCDIPDNVRLKRPLNIPEGLSEQEVLKLISSMADKNKIYRSIFLGAGAYRHYIPAVVDSVCQKEEFLTSYTPYQPEISQGTLQAIFEFQTMMCRLTGMDVSNASVYDGACAAAEAAAMCRERGKNKVLISGAVNPQTIQTVKTYCFGSDTPFEILQAENGTTSARWPDTENTCCIIVQQPNFYGIIEDIEGICNAAHQRGIKVIVICNPVSLALLKTPGECGADIAVGDAQPLGIPLSYGGPYLGFMTCKKELVRRLPGRIVGQTQDSNGRRAFVLTLQAREQHIRREKASSSICSNQALCALRASVYLGALGPAGLEEVANHCVSKAHYMAEKLCSVKGFSLVWEKEFFHEFLTYCPNPGLLNSELDRRGILGGLEQDDKILWCVTEENSIEDIDMVVSVAREVFAG